MTRYKPLICLICGTGSKMPHYKTCGRNHSKDKFKLQGLIHNYPKIDLSDKDLIQKLYVELEEYVLSQLSTVLELHPL